jgi:hypothetical protein
MRRYDRYSIYLGFVSIFKIFVMPFIIPQWLANNKTFVWINIIIFLSFLYISNKSFERLNNRSKEDLRDDKIRDILK